VNHAGKTLVFFTRLKVRDDALIFLTKDQVQAKGIALPTNKTTLIIGRIV
jgi:hypothetical protein